MAAWACQDTRHAKVTNDDDEERENRSDYDEAHEGNEDRSYVCACVSLPRLEVIRICGGPLLGFFGHESCITHPAQHSPTLLRSTVISVLWISLRQLIVERVKEEIKGILQ